MIYPSTVERNSRFFIKFFYRLQVNDADQLRVEVTNEADKTQAEVIDDADETQAEVSDDANETQAEVIEDPDEPMAEVTYDADEFQAAMVNEVDDATFIICVHGSDGGASDDDAKDLDPVEASALLERHDLVAAVTPQKPPTPRKMRKCRQVKIPNDGDRRLQNVRQKSPSSKPPAKIAKRVRTPIRSKSSKSIRIHAKKPANDFKCNQCGKSYAYKYRLERHQLTHTGERFKCNFCDKTYSRPDHRKRHEREKH